MSLLAQSVVVLVRNKVVCPFQLDAQNNVEAVEVGRDSGSDVR